MATLGKLNYDKSHSPQSTISLTHAYERTYSGTFARFCSTNTQIVSSTVELDDFWSDDKIAVVVLIGRMVDVIAAAKEVRLHQKITK